MTFNTSGTSRKEGPIKRWCSCLVLLLFDKILYFFLVPNFGTFWLFLQINFIWNQKRNKPYKYTKNLNDTWNTTLSMLKVKNWIWDGCLWNIVSQIWSRSWNIESSTDVHYKNYNFILFQSKRKIVSYRIRTCAGKPIWFRVKLLNHSDKLTSQQNEVLVYKLKTSAKWRTTK